MKFTKREKEVPGLGTDEQLPAPSGRRENKSQLVTRFGHGRFNNSKGLPSQSRPLA
jgi:hypothetical protein